jgi:uncharacterized membrane protein
VVAGSGVALAFGLSFALITPPSQAPDEPAHFRRAYAVSEGQLWARRQGDLVGGEIPASVVAFSHEFLDGFPFHPERKMAPGRILAALRLPLRPEDRQFIAFPNTALYGVVSYLPQASALALGRVFTDSVLLLFYLGRLANAVSAALLLGLALRLVPFFRPVFFLVGLLPMTVFLAGSFSADAVTNGLAFVLTAFAMRCAFGGDDRLAFRDLGVLALLAILISLAKPGYSLLAGLVFLIPRGRLGSRRRYAFAGSLVVLAALGTSAFCAAVLRGRGVLRAPSPAVHDAGPLGLVLQMLTDQLRRAPSLAVQFVGKLGWADVSIPVALLAANGLVLLLAALTSGCGPRVPRFRDRVLVASVVLAVVLVVTIPFYVSLVPPGPEGASAHRPQGRYLIAAAPAALLLLANCRWPFAWEERIGLLTGWAAFVLGVAVFSVAARYYL